MVGRSYLDRVGTRLVLSCTCESTSGWLGWCEIADGFEISNVNVMGSVDGRDGVVETMIGISSSRSPSIDMMSPFCGDCAIANHLCQVDRTSSPAYLVDHLRRNQTGDLDLLGSSSS